MSTRDAASFKARTIRCPACGGPSRYAPDNASRPFCSERCRHLDLGAWANEAYRVAAPQTLEDEGNADDRSRES